MITVKILFMAAIIIFCLIGIGFLIMGIVDHVQSIIETYINIQDIGGAAFFSGLALLATSGAILLIVKMWNLLEL